MERGGDATQSPRRLREDDNEALAAYLLSFHWSYQNQDVYRSLIDGALPLWRHVLEITPDRAERGTALELGSPPFHMTLLLNKFRNYDLSLTGFAVDGRSELVQEVESQEFGERHTFSCTCFDVERDAFPYADASFDVVFWCEVIEHLTENPVHTLAEIHRVLKPNGSVVISTPNVARIGNAARILSGKNIYDPYHLGAPLKGSRHSREWTLQEVTELVSGCGFRVEVAKDLDLNRPVAWRRLLRSAMNSVIARLTGGHYRSHLFVRARKTADAFRWNFPGDVFDYGHLAFFVHPTAATVTMGANDQVHTAMGWGELTTGAGGRPMRRSAAVGDVYLRCPPGVRRVEIALCDGTGEAQVWQTDENGTLLLRGSTRFDAASREWVPVVVDTGSDCDPALFLHVRLATESGGVNVHSVTAS